MIRTIFTYAPFGVGLLVMFGLIFPNCRQLQLRTRTQAIWAMVILFCCSKFLCFKAFGGDEFTPDLPAAVIWIWDWLYSGAIILAALALLTVFFRFRAKLWSSCTTAAMCADSIPRPGGRATAISMSRRGADSGPGSRCGSSTILKSRS